MSQRRLIRIASGCKTEDQFVAVFNRFCDGNSIFIATRTPKPVGETLNFCVTLADGEPLLAGTGSVSECYVDKTGPFARPGMRIRFSELDEGSEVLARLAAAADKKPPKPPDKKQPRATMLGVPAIIAPAKPSATPPPTPPPTPAPATVVVAPESHAAAPESSAVEAPKLGLPPPVISTRPPPPRKPTPPPIPKTRSVDDSWSEEPKAPESKPPKPEPDPEPAREPESVSEQVPRAIGSENEASSDEIGDAVDALTERGGTESERAPGSDIVLPANPFGELNTESLEHFVECTIYEERAATSEPSGELALDPTKGESSDDRDVDLGDDGGDDRGDLVSGLIDEPAEPAVIVNDRPTFDPPVATAAIPARPAVTNTAMPETMPFAAPGERTVPMTWALGGVAVALIAGLFVGYLIWGGGDNSNATSRRSAVSEVAAAPAPEAAPEPEPTPAPESAPEPAPTAEPAPAEPALAVAADTCSVDVGTEPEGSTVTLGAKTLGETPGNFVVPCGAVTVTVSHPRYAALTRTLTARPGVPAELEGRLGRPDVKLRIGSRPSGARVSVNGRSVGVSPVSLTVKGFERTKVVVTKRGYKTASRRLYLKKDGGVSIRLVRAPRKSRSRNLRRR
jgi:hypothetical protein